MNNVRFSYLYRDGSNYKKWGEIVFSNPKGISDESVSKKLRKAFLSDGLFVAHQVRVPEVFLAAENQLTEDDHCFHEFDSVKITFDPPDDRHGRSIGDFVAEASHAAQRGWQAFDPRGREGYDLQSYRIRRLY
jgi:hypothetical protein